MLQILEKITRIDFLFLFDAGFYSFFLLWSIQQKGCHCIMKVSKSLTLRAIPGSRMFDGSYLAVIKGKIEDPANSRSGGRLKNSFTGIGFKGVIPGNRLIATYDSAGTNGATSYIVELGGGNFTQTNAGDEFGFMRKNKQGVMNLQIFRTPQVIHDTLTGKRLATDWDIGSDIIAFSGIR